MAESDRQEYVCGFMFSPDRQRVLLIKKNRPSWQAGKYNGAGGKIEAGETPEAAMRREFREEAGIDQADWRYFARISGYHDHFCVHFFYAIGDLDEAQSLTDETIVTLLIPNLAVWPLVRGLRWLIQLALEGNYQLVTAVDEVFK